ncbi:MAG: hypothetical protein ACRCT8_08925 [Lacipirellulaceae bacterium]
MIRSLLALSFVPVAALAADTAPSHVGSSPYAALLTPAIDAPLPVVAPASAAQVDPLAPVSDSSADVGADALASAPDDTPIETAQSGAPPAIQPLATLGPQIDLERGDPNGVLDGVGWVLGIPSKLVLWDSRVNNHAVSEKTVEDATEFLADNGVSGVMVRVNQYDPLGEWQRLIENDKVGVGWRATVGSLYTLGYSVLPGRLFGGDWYNPFTDTVHVYSDVPALALEQAAAAKDTREKTHPGFYSAVRLLPFVGIVHEARSKQKVFAHVDANGTVEERAEARRVLQPQMGAEVGGQAALLAPGAQALLSVGGAAVGHVVGRVQAARIEDEAVTQASAEGPVGEALDDESSKR